MAPRVPIRALALVTVVLTLGIGGYVGVSSVTDGSATRAIDPAAPSTADDAERPDLNTQVSGSDGPKTDGSSPEPGTSAPEQPTSPFSPSNEPPPSSVEPDLETDSPSTSTTPSTPSTPTAPSTRPSARPTQSPTSRNPEDRTPPNTSLSEEYPEPDSARFSFSANERASFACSLDGAAYTSCESPTLYTDLEPGWHDFAVRATDAAGNVDPSPAQTRWHSEGGPSEDE